MVLALILGSFLLGVCLVLVARAALAPRLRATNRLSEIDAYGFSAEAAPTGLSGDVEDTGLSALASRLGGVVLRRFGGVRESALRQELVAAGMYTTNPRALLGYRLLVAIVPALVLVALGASSGSATLLIVLAIVIVPLGWMVPLVLVRRRARLRHEQVDRQLPELIDLLVVTLEGGLSFSGSMRLAARELDEPLGQELLLTLQEQSMGLDMSDALANLTRRCDTPSTRSFVRALVQGERLGISTGQIMRDLAVEMRKRRRQRAEERAQQAPLKMLFPLIFLIFPTLFIVLLVPAAFEVQKAFQ
jgi:tight adherence protein C